MASLLAATALLLVAGCALNPATGGANMVVSSMAGEVKQGREMHEEMMSKGAAYDDPELQDYVNGIGQRLAKHSDMPDLEWTFTVIDAPDLNAFALPGGFVYINRGLLAYLDSEAQLAGVIGHEIAHVTARHHARRKSAGVTSKVLSTTAYIFTGSRDVYAASSMYGAEIMSGFGRDMELEADGFGAEYMYRAGYEPEALLDVVGVLKNQQLFQRVKAKSSGQSVGTYHGVYATHPRNDKRLQTVIQAAAKLNDGAYVESPEKPGEFRRQTDGLVWGRSAQGQRDRQRYYHNKLGFTIEKPEGWDVEAGAQAVFARAPGDDASVRITLMRRDPSTSPEQVMRNSASGELSSGAAIEQAGLQGYTAVASAGDISKRLAVIDFNNLTYRFEGTAADFAGNDAALKTIIESFRPIHPQERQTGQAQYLRYIQVPRGATLQSLAASMRIPDAEAQLRLINGFYPRGEPRTGDWIKVIR
ncbi:MAG: M48 family metalloprotease [Chromatocurvus sp.]